MHVRWDRRIPVVRRSVNRTQSLRLVDTTFWCCGRYVGDEELCIVMGMGDVTRLGLVISVGINTRVSKLGGSRHIWGSSWS